jgi:hypothetical protein
MSNVDLQIKIMVRITSLTISNVHSTLVSVIVNYITTSKEVDMRGSIIQ